jgi:hypothetical protein
MVSLSVAGQQPTIHLSEDLPNVSRQPLQCRRIEYLVPVFGDADRSAKILPARGQTPCPTARPEGSRRGTGGENH